MLELRNVTKTVGGADHLRDVSLALHHGSLSLAPQLKLENEKEQPVTVNYDELVKSWSE